MFEYIDWMSQQVVVVYEDERERWLENQNSLRGLRVREILAANQEPSTSMRRPPRSAIRCGGTTSALVMWYPDQGAEGDELARLQRFFRELGEAAGVDASPLFVAADRSCGWGVAAVSGRGRPTPWRRFAGSRQTDTDSPSVAIGTMAAGVEGFRRSHREAAEARDVAIVTRAAELVDADGDRRQ